MNSSAGAREWLCPEYWMIVYDDVCLFGSLDISCQQVVSTADQL